MSNSIISFSDDDTYSQNLGESVHEEEDDELDYEIQFSKLSNTVRNCKFKRLWNIKFIYVHNMDFTAKYKIKVSLKALFKRS